VNHQGARGPRLERAGARRRFPRLAVTIVLSLFVVLLVTPVAAQAAPPPVGTGYVAINGVAVACSNLEVTLDITVAPRAQEMRFSNDGGASWSAYEPVATAKVWTPAPGADGPRTVTVEFHRPAPHESSSIAEDSIFLDRAAPRTEGVPGADAAYYNAAIALVFGGWTDPDPSSGLAVFDYQVAGQGWRSFGLPLGTATVVLDPSALADGEQTVVFHATDVAGNAEADRSVVRYTDTTAPVTSDDYDGGWSNAPVQLGLTAQDAGAGIADTFFSLDDGATWTSGTTVGVEAPADHSADGSHAVRYYSVDAAQPAGNAESPKTATVLIDTAAPVTTITPSADISLPVDGDVTLALSAVDPLPGSGVETIEYSVDGGDWTNGDTVTVAAPADHSNDGAHTVAARAVDIAGNVGGSQSADVVIDTTAPVTTITGYDGSWSSSDVTFAFSAEDAGAGVDFVRYSVDGGDWVVGDGVTVPASSGDGTHSLSVQAVDKLGIAEDPQSLVVRIDTAAPVSVVTGVDGDWHNTDVTLSVSATDAEPGAGVAATYYRLNGGAWQQATGGEIVVPAPVDHSLDGTVAVDVYSTDGAVAPNAEAVQTFEVRIDTTAPVTVASGAGQGWLTAPVTLAFVASESGGSGYAYTEYSLDGGLTWSQGLSVTLATSKIWTVLYRSADILGNVEGSRTATVKLDLVGPRTSAKHATARKGVTVRLKYKATDNLSSRVYSLRVVVKNARGKTVKTVRVAGCPVGVWYSVKWKPLKKGAYRYTVYAKDAAGLKQSRIGAAKVLVK